MMVNRAVPGLPAKVFPAIVSTGAGFGALPGASRESVTEMWPQKNSFPPRQKYAREGAGRFEAKCPQTVAQQGQAAKTAPREWRP